METANMKILNNLSFDYENVIHLVEINDYKGAIEEIERYIKSSDDYNDLAFYYLNCGFLNTKLREYPSAVNDFSKAIDFENKLDTLIGRSKDISLHARSNARYRYNDYKGAIDDKRKAKNIRLLEIESFPDSIDTIIDYKHISLGTLVNLDLEPKYKTLIKVSKIKRSKYDLIADYKKVISNKRKEQVIQKLEVLSESKYKIGDYKSSIRAIRRAEKYY